MQKWKEKDQNLFEHVYFVLRYGFLFWFRLVRGRIDLKKKILAGC
jgi:hypothetical protein